MMIGAMTRSFDNLHVITQRGAERKRGFAKTMYEQHPPFAQGGSSTSPTGRPFCRTPKFMF